MVHSPLGPNQKSWMGKKSKALEINLKFDQTHTRQRHTNEDRTYHMLLLFGGHLVCVDMGTNFQENTDTISAWVRDNLQNIMREKLGKDVTLPAFLFTDQATYFKSAKFLNEISKLGLQKALSFLVPGKSPDLYPHESAAAMLRNLMRHVPEFAHVQSRLGDTDIELVRIQIYM